MKKKFYKAQLGILNYGIGIDSGVDHSEFFSAMVVDTQKFNEEFIEHKKLK